MSKEETLSYGVGALQRDLDYLKRMNANFFQHPVGSGLLRSPSQELPSKPRFAGKKRKAASRQPEEPTPRASHGRSLLPAEHPDKRAPPQPLWTQMQSLPNEPLREEESRQHQLSSQKPPHTQVGPVWCEVCDLNCVTLHNLKIHVQGKKHKIKLGMQKKAMSDELTLRVRSRSRDPPKKDAAPAWCSLCKVNCKNPQNLRRHLQGRKHKAGWGTEFPPGGHEAGSSEIDKEIETVPVWCTLCKLNCMNPQNLKRHLLGKKHKARWDEQPVKSFCPDNPQALETEVAPVWCKTLEIGLHGPG